MSGPRLGQSPTPRRRVAVISTVRNEERFLGMTADSLGGQTLAPCVWLVVDDGSTDRTVGIISAFAASHEWVSVVELGELPGTNRCSRVMRAFLHGYSLLDGEYDYVVKVDGDVSFDADHFERLVAEFERDDALGIASGTYTEPVGGGWVVHTLPEGYAQGAVRMYRAACLAEVVDAARPLTESTCAFEPAPSARPLQLSWDSIDHLYAEEAGWSTRCFHELVVVHHRTEGAREHVLRGWYEQGVVSYAMGYHPLFALARGVRKTVEYPYVVGGMALTAGYLGGALGRGVVRADERTRRLVRGRQLRRIQGALGMGGRQPGSEDRSA